ncbi:amino acid ABC transporter permease [Caldimonas caldifontis]|uniref:Amino acid ABC transporter permease n=1 Tax=Caldimonas caldifontis TaxID=1452508 RepID=A0A2S5SX00_9BURK|nr:amino acid ABC transporter permease [Caldimonas caldifontis]PPE67256.1 amino acid ABC transporter permease [Caldimonas caldifontis]
MFSNERVRGIAYQVLLLAAVVGVGWYLVSNTLHNLSTRQIQVGFGFLGREAGFEIAEKLIEYDATHTYARAFGVGLLNTLKVAVLGVVLATVLGTLIGIARLSSNWLLAKLASGYVEVMRNVPLLLQLFVWYGLFTELLPPVREAITLGDWLFATQRGFWFAWPAAHPAWTAAAWALLAGIVLAWVWRMAAARHQQATGQRWPVGWVSAALILGLPLLAWAVMGAPTEMDVPQVGGFSLQGGRSISPEFTALLLGLSTYTAAFVAEVVRAGILAVDRGQTEAAQALGLNAGQRLRLVTLPQALRVIIPPMTSQYLNLTKNSSLAVAIGYPDLVAVANTTMNQTGQAIEAIAILMAVYLTISLAISLFMNWYNDRVKLVER